MSRPILIGTDEAYNAPGKSLVQVAFPGHGAFTYFNDSFPLRPGDVVFVDGKLEGIRGRVTQITYNFKIKTSDYHRVIAVADTKVHGEFFFAGSHFVTFDPHALPVEQARGWFLPPADGADCEQGWDDFRFPLADLRQMKAAPQIAERGYDYYVKDRVSYLCVDDTRGYAIVEGTHPYEVEFEYRDGQIGKLTCSCYCTYPCKHEVAALLQLTDLLNHIEQHYHTDFWDATYFAAILKPIFMSAAVNSKESGSLTL